MHRHHHQIKPHQHQQIKHHQAQPMLCLYGRHRHLPLEVEKYVEHIDKNHEEIENLTREEPQRMSSWIMWKIDSNDRCTFPKGAVKHRSCPSKAKAAVPKKKRRL